MRIDITPTMSLDTVDTVQLELVEHTVGGQVAEVFVYVGGYDLTVPGKSAAAIADAFRRLADRIEAQPVCRTHDRDTRTSIRLDTVSS